MAFSAMQSVTQNPSLTADEATAASVASGGATYTDLGGDDTPNLWSILVRLGPVIPKVLFSPATDPYWAEVALVILAEQAADKLVEAIPFIGQVVSVVEVLADVASLAEVCSETIVSPWVIENEVSLTYQATITVGHDPVASGWPATAETWELSALDGRRGHAQHDFGPSERRRPRRVRGAGLLVTAPYGSNTIQWSIVIKDAEAIRSAVASQPSTPTTIQTIRRQRWLSPSLRSPRLSMPRPSSSAPTPSSTATPLVASPGQTTHPSRSRNARQCLRVARQEVIGATVTT